MTDYMVTGLVKRRAALAGDMKCAQEALSQMARDLETDRVDNLLAKYRILLAFSRFSTAIQPQF